MKNLYRKKLVFVGVLLCGLLSAPFASQSVLWAADVSDGQTLEVMTYTVTGLPGENPGSSEGDPDDGMHVFNSPIDSPDGSGSDDSDDLATPERPQSLCEIWFLTLMGFFLNSL